MMSKTIDNEANKGPTEKLRDDEKSDAGQAVSGAEGVPGAQNPDSDEIKQETNPNTE